jgi:deazaflavin-dependent oxidoreductase (nitroreductase family)
MSEAGDASGEPEPQFLYLTTMGRRTGLPRRIEIWFTRRHGRFYVISELHERAHWVQNILVEPRVRFSMGDLTFEGHARVIDTSTERELHDEIQALSRQKYGWGDGLVVELTTRSELGRCEGA